jgi:uncharacterized membrane protein YqiK
MLGNLASLILIVLILALIVWIATRLLSRSYVKTTPGAAFVRTGGLRGAAARPLVVMNGAAWVFGFLHRIKWVSLETMALEVRHLEENALITLDPQYVDFEARFFIKIGSSPESISAAARSIGGDSVDEARVRRLVEPKVNGAVRDVAATFALKNLLEKRHEFIKQVKERLQDDLAENGLILESVSILTLKPTLQGRFSTDDILGAQVARANAAVIELALTEKNKLEKMAAVDRARQDAEAEREQLAIEEGVERERAERAKNIALVRAAEEAAARVGQEEKREEGERAHILAERALREAALENERLEALLREQLQQAVELERVMREQALALADEERQKRVAEAITERMATLRTQIEADQEREQALQAAMTASEKAAAEREAEIELINARFEAERQGIEQRTQVELESLRQKEMADVEREIAAAQAEATRIRAEAELEAAKMSAVAERERASAAGLAEVQVSAERVKVLLKEAEAVRNKLIAEADGEKAMAEALASHGKVAQELEMARLSAEALKAIEIAKAEALGEAISGMKMNLFGDAATAQRLLQLVAGAQATGHVYEALPAGARAILQDLGDRLGISRSAGTNGVGDNLSKLVEIVQMHYPSALDDNPTLGELADKLRHENGVPQEIAAMLSRVADNPHLSELRLAAALQLAKDWLGAEILA